MADKKPVDKGYPRSINYPDGTWITVDKGYPRSINYPDGTWITVLNSKEYNSVMAMYLTSAKDFSIERWRASNK